MERIDMQEVLTALNLPFPDGRGQFSLYCPKCDDGSGRKHLAVNARLGLFNCVRCGVHGGIIQMYALFAECSEKEAVHRLLEWRKGRGTIPRPAPAFTVKQNEIASLEARSNTYAHLLLALDLKDRHRENLLKRGLPEEALFRYRSVPSWGSEKDLTKRLIEEGCEVKGVPGFFVHKGEWTFQRLKNGFLIPALDVDGNIQGLKVRLDDETERKYRWISTAELPEGTASEAYCHIAGSVTESMFLTEGELKADIVSCFTGRGVISVPGVNSLGKVPETVAELVKRGMKEVWICYDMDLYTNPNVQRGYGNLKEILSSFPIKVGTYRWDPAYKGIDDYLLHLKQTKKR